MHAYVVLDIFLYLPHLTLQHQLCSESKVWQCQNAVLGMHREVVSDLPDDIITKRHIAVYNQSISLHNYSNTIMEYSACSIY